MGSRELMSVPHSAPKSFGNKTAALPRPFSSGANRTAGYMYEGPSRTSGYGDMNRFPLNATAGYLHEYERAPTGAFARPYGTSSFARPSEGFGRPNGTSSFARPGEGFGRPNGTSSFARPSEGFGRPHGTSTFAREAFGRGQRTAGYPYGFAHTDAFADFSRLSVN